MSTIDSGLSRSTRVSGNQPLGLPSPYYADNPFAPQTVANAWLGHFRRLFIGRDDTYGERNIGIGPLSCIRASLTDAVLHEHLLGNHVIYVYPQNVIQRGVKICVLDVDCHGEVPEGVIDDRRERNFAYMSEVWRRLRESNLPVLLEDSDGRGGLHLWMFVDSFSNSEAISAAAWMASLAEPGDLSVERFPRGNTADEGHPGLCIRLPGRHHRQYHFSQFWNGTDWVDAAAAVEMLNQIRPVPTDQLPEGALSFQPPITVRSAISGTAQQQVWTDHHSPPEDVIRAALEHLGLDYYDGTRDEWLRVGIGIHSCAQTADERNRFFDIWKAWSIQAPDRWNEQDARRDWDSFQAGGPFQWQNLIQLAMNEGYDPPTRWHPDHSRQLNVDTASATPYVPVPPAGDAVSIDMLRDAVVQSRIVSLENPGIFLDRSGTGSGKSTADLLVAGRNKKILVLVPDHTNANEVAAEARRRRLPVIIFPKRVFGNPDTDQNTSPNPAINCWNPEADRAQSAGLAIQHTVCRSCAQNARCRSSGYLHAVRHANSQRTGQSAVVVMTHRRAQLKGLARICNRYSIDYVAVHENLIDFLAPVYSLTLRDLEHLQNLLRMLTVRVPSLRETGILTAPGNGSSFARFLFQVQPERESNLPENKRLAKQNLRDWILRAPAIIRQLQSSMTSESTTGGSIDLRGLMFSQQNYPTDHLQALLWTVTQEASRRNIVPQPGTVSGQSPATAAPVAVQSSAMRLLMELTTGNVRRLERTPGVGSSGARLIVVSDVGLPTGIPVWLNDATGSRDTLSSIISGIVDRTPQMHAGNQHSVLQVPEFDITRGQRSGQRSTLGKALRHVLNNFPEKLRICIFCHRNHVEGIRAQAGDRVKAVHYFHSGIARGSNSLYTEHDLLVILGTPRAAGPVSVLDRLAQLGRINSMNEPGGWGTCSSQITDRRSNKRVIARLKYDHPDWDAAYRSIVEAELHQIIGRARPTLQEGCDVVLVSSHLICSSFLENAEISLTAMQDTIWQICRTLPDSFAPRDIRDNSTNLKDRTITASINRLIALNYIERSGTAGGRSTRYRLVTRSQNVRGTSHDGGDEQESEIETIVS